MPYWINAAVDIAFLHLIGWGFGAWTNIEFSVSLGIAVLALLKAHKITDGKTDG